MATNKVSEYMIELGKKLRETKNVSESTANAYVRALYVLNDKKPFKTLTFLKKTDKIDEMINKYAESTIKSIYASIVSVLSLFKDTSTYKKIYQYYHDKMMGKVQEAKSVDTSEKTTTQKDNWIEWSEVQKIEQDLEDAVDDFIKRKVIDATQYDKLLRFLVLSLYTQIQPRRNLDYLDMIVVKEDPQDKVQHNYLVLEKTRPSHFIFNRFKTSKKYGSQKIDIPEKLGAVIKTYLKFHPLRKQKEYPFLVSHDGTPLTAVNSITRLLNRIFGKRVGSSMLRHIFLSNKYDIKEMEKDAEAMGHSVEEQKKYLKGSGESVCVVEVPEYHAEESSQ